MLKVEGHTPCPCGSGEIFKGCCQLQVEWVVRKGRSQEGWHWLYPDVQAVLALVCGLQGIGGGVVPTVAEITASAEMISRLFAEAQCEEEYEDVLVELMGEFGALVLEGAILDQACSLIPPQWVADFLDELVEEFSNHGDDLHKDRGRAIIEEVFERWSLLPVEEAPVEDLPWAVAQGLRHKPLNQEERAAIIMALISLAANPLDQLTWHFIFRGAVTRQVEWELLEE